MKALEMAAEQFKCLIPTPDALKEGVLYCSSNATNAADIWIAAGTIVGVMITAVMASFAWRAWNTAQEQLEHARQASIKEQRYPALLEMLVEFDRLLRWTRDDSASLDERKAQVEQQAELWLLSHELIYDSGLFPRMLGELRSVLSNNRGFKSMFADPSLPLSDTQRQAMKMTCLHSEVAIGFVKVSVRRTALDLFRGVTDENSAMTALEECMDILRKQLAEFVSLEHVK